MIWRKCLLSGLIWLLAVFGMAIVDATLFCRLNTMTLGNSPQREGDPHGFGGLVDTTSPLNIVHAQMETLQRGSTVVAYQLASPKNRLLTAFPGGYNYCQFDRMMRTMIMRPLLSGYGYQII